MKNENTPEPLISVVMPVYNSAKYLREAIESILGQTYQNFEFFIFNDGSSDESHQIITSYQDPRIRYHSYATNSGYVPHLNKGIELAQGKYIARMDSDDVSLPTRFAEQVAFLETHSTYGVCGSSFTFIGNATHSRILPIEDEEIKVKLITSCVISHPSVMMRRRLLIDNKLAYNESVAPAEDYYLWCALSPLTKFYNLPTPLLKYRAHEGQISQYKKLKQIVGANTARRNYFKVNGFKIDSSEADALRKLVELEENEALQAEDLRAVNNAANALINQNQRLRFFNDDQLKAFAGEKWAHLTDQIRSYSPAFIPPLLLSNKAFAINMPLRTRAMLLAKSLLSWKTRI